MPRRRCRSQRMASSRARAPEYFAHVNDYLPGVGADVSTQSDAVFVSMLSVLRMREWPAATGGEAGENPLTFVPHDTASTVTPLTVLSRTTSPAFAKPLPSG